MMEWHSVVTPVNMEYRLRARDPPRPSALRASPAGRCSAGLGGCPCGHHDSWLRLWLGGSERAASLHRSMNKGVVPAFA